MTFCFKCGNYEKKINSTGHCIPQKAICWKYHNISGDCYDNPNKASYAQLRKRAIIVTNPDIYDPKECTICLKLMRGRFVKKVPCGHTFHIKCLKQWENRSVSCPTCRYKYGEADLDILSEKLQQSYVEFNIMYNTMISEYRKFLRIANDIRRHHGELPEIYDEVRTRIR